ncbi:MAG TPA: response regulator, partial [Polyangia bacterium]|nr:response regulator [Polyangia bacterium]
MTHDKPKVLLVDDVEANLVALEGLLGNLHCDLVRSTSGNQALRLLLQQEFAVMLLDVQMPGMDGYEVAYFVHDNPATREVPIIFVTALPETKENVLRGYESGAFDLLFKPIDPYILRSKVQIFLDLYASRLELRREIEAHKRTLAEVEAFNYSVSHDLRAPLRPLDGFSEALLEDYGDKLDDKAKDYLNRIRLAAQRMGQLIEDLLELSRIGRVAVPKQPVDLSALAASIVAEL